MKTVLMCLAATTAFVAAPCAAVTNITFANVPGAVGASVSSYTESGYTFTATGGSLTTQRIATSPLLGTTSTATVDLIYGGGTFRLLTLGSLAQGSGIGSIAYTGYLAGGSVFSGTLPANANLGALYIAMPAFTVDKITFTLNAGTTANTNFSFSTAEPAAVTTPALPEPATWGMMILGFGAIGWAMRPRQRLSARIRFV